MVGFWIFMFLMILLFPLFLLVMGIVFVKKPPKSIGSLYGYNTSRSLQNDETWAFAHAYCGKIWLILGMLMLILSVLIYTIPTLVLEMQKEISGIIGGAIVGVQLLCILVTRIPVERALKKNFDSFGVRR